MTHKLFLGHTEKIYFVHFHPLARDLLLTGSYDMSVRIWDLESGSEIAKLEDHPDQVRTVFYFSVLNTLKQYLWNP